MKQVIYIDILIFVNLLVNYFLLLTVRGFLHVPVSRGRIFLGACAGALGSLMIFLPQPHWSIALLCRLLLSAVMVFACFFPVSRKLFCKLLALLYLAGFAFAGFMLAFSAMNRSFGMLMNNGVLYFPVSPMLLLLLSCASYGIMALLRRFTEPREPKGRFCTVTVYHGGKSQVLHGKIDTGCTLTEPFSHRPALVAEKSALSGLLPDCLQGSSRNSWQKGIRMIPFHAVSGTGLLPGFVPERLEITLNGETREICGCWLAVCGQRLGNGEFDILVPPAVFD